MSLLCAVSPICQVGPRLGSAARPVLSATHTLVRLTFLWLASIQREKSGSQWPIDRCTVVLPSSSWFQHALLLLTSPRLSLAVAASVAPTGFFKRSTMLRVFHSWLESMWSGHGAQAAASPRSITGQMVSSTTFFPTPPFFSFYAFINSAALLFTLLKLK